MMMDLHELSTVSETFFDLAEYVEVGPADPSHVTQYIRMCLLALRQAGYQPMGKFERCNKFMKRRKTDP